MRHAAAVLAIVGLLLPGCRTHETVVGIPARAPVTLDRAIEAAPSQAVAEIEEHGVLRHPSVDEILLMKRSGVSDIVIAAMLKAPVTTARPGEFRVHSWTAPDWKTIGDVVLGVFYVALKVAEGAARCCCGR